MPLLKFLMCLFFQNLMKTSISSQGVMLSACVNPGRTLVLTAKRDLCNRILAGQNSSPHRPIMNSNCRHEVR